MKNMNNEQNGTTTGIYALIVGGLYALAGLLEIVTGFGIGAGPLAGLAGILHVVGDAFNGFVLIVIGLVFLRGVQPYLNGDREAVSYTTVGALMASTLFLFYVLNALSNGLGFMLGFEDRLEWTILDNIKPGVLLWVAAIPSIFLSKRKNMVKP